MKFAAGVTLYNPIHSYIDNIIRIARIFDVVYVWDNSKEKSSFIQAFDGIENIIYTHNPQNDGLSHAFNQMIQYCIDEEIAFLCTLDQDSVFIDSQIIKIKNHIESMDMKNVAIIAPTPIEQDERIDNETCTELLLQQVKWVICSGAFVNIQLLKENDIWYDDNYFIDRFDQDFCTQIERKQLEIYRISNVFIHHSCGENHEHNVLRHYYIFRNRLYYNDKYFQGVRGKLRTFLQILKHLRVIFKEKNGMLKMKAFKIAYKDYKNGNMGRISESSLKKIDF